jgi:hypothetical protein
VFKKILLKQLITGLAIAGLLCSSGGYVLIYYYSLQNTKHEIQTAIKEKKIKKNLIWLSFKKRDIEEKKINFVWKHSREFRFNGSMYDIVERKDTKDSVFFYCYLDKKENHLEKNLEKHYQKEKENKKGNTPERIF